MNASENSNGNGKANWLLAAGLLFALVGGAWRIIVLQNELTKAQTEIEISDKLTAVRIDAAAHRAETDARLVEIETQFRAEDQIRNVQWADARRTMAIIYEDTHPGKRYPSDISFFPEIAQPTK